jgi:hypothetical protein
MRRGTAPAPRASAPATASEAASSGSELPPGTPASAVGTPAANPAAGAAAPLPSGLVMELAPKADCWVSVTVDGEQAFSGVMRAGEKRQIAARDEISVNVGDAGAFAYTLNGKEGRPLGAPGEVVSKRITLADFADYITP